MTDRIHPLSVIDPSAKLGEGVRVGPFAVIGPGVEIGEGSAVGAMSFVPKGTKIPPNQIWGGVPARLVKKYEEEHAQPGIPAMN
jgi:acetyltransferase-like isoleucine patch superfamily enzyme